MFALAPVYLSFMADIRTCSSSEMFIIADVARFRKKEVVKYSVDGGLFPLQNRLTYERVAVVKSPSSSRGRNI